jgi:hypothetical protein
MRWRSRSTKGSGRRWRWWNNSSNVGCKPVAPAQLLRVFLALIGAPLGGYLTAKLCCAMESRILLLLNVPAPKDDRPARAEFIIPLIVIVIVGFCWIYVVPVSWELQKRRLIVPLCGTVLPPWLLSFVLLHNLGPPITTLGVTGYYVGLPVFVASLIASAAFRFRGQATAV